MHAKLPWYLILTLFLGLTIPSACVIWMMTQALDNQRMALKQRVADLQQVQLSQLALDWSHHLQQELSRLLVYSNNYSEMQKFSMIVKDNYATSAVFVGESIRSYSTEAPNPPQYFSSAPWENAHHIEFHAKQPLAAWTAYQALSDQAESIHERADALLAQSRCLMKANRKQEALKLLKTHFINKTYTHSISRNGKSLRVSALLLAFDIANQIDTPNSQIKKKLAHLLLNYELSYIPASQRFFAMQKINLNSIFHSAERLSNHYLSRNKIRPKQFFGSNITPTGIGTIWQLKPPQSSIFLLFDEQFFQEKLIDYARDNSSLDTADIQLLPPLETAASDNAQIAPIGAITLQTPLSHWRILLHENDESNLQKPHTFAYIWISLLFCAALASLIAIVARFIFKQISLNRLKSSLISTVSHELKTPLSSASLLLETLIHSEEKFSDRTQEYLELIHHENKQLARLIDNFLTFSRMEYNKHLFYFELIEAKNPILSALSGLNEKLTHAGFSISVNIDSNLPLINADSAMLVTVFNNLLDNAYKYSQDDKRIIVGVALKNRAIEYSITDHGIGIAADQKNKIFDRFYRVDQRLARDTQGCGLGLNIARYIITQHAGKIEVHSESHHGSCFIVTIPINKATLEDQGNKI